MVEETSNGKITLALLGQGMGRVQEDLKEIKTLLKENVDCAKVIETKVTVIDTQLNSQGGIVTQVVEHEEAINDLRKLNNWWSGANTLLGLIATSLAALLGIKNKP